MNEDILLEFMKQPKKIYTVEELQFKYLRELIQRMDKDGLEFNDADYTFRLPTTDKRHNDSFVKVYKGYYEFHHYGHILGYKVPNFANDCEFNSWLNRINTTLKSTWHNADEEFSKTIAVI